MAIIAKFVRDNVFVLSLMTSIFENTVETEKIYKRKSFGDYKRHFKYECGLLRKPVYES